MDFWLQTFWFYYSYLYGWTKCNSLFGDGFVYSNLWGYFFGFFLHLSWFSRPHLKQRRQHSQVVAHLVLRQMKLIRWTNGSLKRCCCSWFWSLERASHWLGWLQRVSSCTASPLGTLSCQSGLHPWMPGDFRYPWSRSLSALMIQTALWALLECKVQFGSFYLSTQWCSGMLLSFSRGWGGEPRHNLMLTTRRWWVTFSSDHIAACWCGTQPLNNSGSEGEQSYQTLLSTEIALLEINAIHALLALWMVSFTQNITLHLVLHLAVIETFPFVFLNAKLIASMEKESET